jgi:hypothetical protein
MEKYLLSKNKSDVLIAISLLNHKGLTFEDIKSFLISCNYMPCGTAIRPTFINDYRFTSKESTVLLYEKIDGKLKLIR